LLNVYERMVQVCANVKPTGLFVDIKLLIYPILTLSLITQRYNVTY